MRLLHLQVKEPQNARIKVLTDKQATTNQSLIFLSARMPNELHQGTFKRR